MRRLVTAILSALVLIPGLDSTAWAQTPTPTPVCQPQNLGNALPLTVFGSTTGAPALYTGTCQSLSGLSPERLYLYTPPVTGQYQIDTFGTEFDTVLYVRQTTCSGTELACDDDVSETLESMVNVNLTSGTPVVIFVDGYNGEAGSFTLHVALSSSLTPTPTLTPPPTFTPTHTHTSTTTPTPTLTPTSPPCQPQNLGNSLPVNVFGSTSGAPILFAGTCRDTQTAASPERVYLYTPPLTGTYDIDTVGSNFDTVVYVRQGTCSSAEIGCNDDVPGTITSRLSLPLTAGMPVVIFVDGFNASGDFALHIVSNSPTPSHTATPTAPGGGTSTATPTITPTVPCQVEDIGNSLPFSLTSTTMGMSRYIGTCRTSQTALSPERLFLYTPPSNGLYQIDTYDSGFDTVLYVRNATCSGMELDCNDDQGFNLTSSVNLQLTQGMPIVIILDGYNGSMGTFNLHINNASSLTPTPTVTPEPPRIAGDCNFDQETTIDELQNCINQFLAGELSDMCLACDSNIDFDVGIADVQGAVNCFLDATSDDCPHLMMEGPA